MISANGVEYKNVPEQVQYLTEQVADIWTAIEGINPPDLTLYALKTYVDAADSALGTRITAVENSIGTLLTKTEAANTYAKIADIGTYINLSDYVKTVDMYTYVQAEIQNFDLDSNTDFTALKSRVSTLESSVSSMTSDIADANATAANAQTAAGNAVNTANNASAVATNAYNTAISAASDVADMQTTINNYDSRIDAVESTVDGFQASLTTAQNTANAALAKADSALSMIAGLHSLTKQEVEFEGDSVTVAGFVEGSLCTLTKLEGNTKESINLAGYSSSSSEFINGTSYSNGVLTFTPGLTGSDQLAITPAVLVAGRTVTVSFYAYASENGAKLRCDLYPDASSPVDFNITLTTTRTKYTYTFNPVDTTTKLRIFRTSTSTGATTATIYVSDIMLNDGSTALDYVPYFDGLKSVSISGLSTGGGVVITTSEGTTSLIPTLDDDTLELRSWSYIEQSITDTSLVTTYVDGGGIVDLGTLNWQYDTSSGSQPIFKAELSDMSTKVGRGAVCSKYSVYNMDTYAGDFANANNNNKTIGARTTLKSLLIKDLDYTDATTFKAAMSGVLLVYERATPVTTVLATVTYTDVSAFFETGAAITVNNANTDYGVESTSTMYGYVAE